MYLSGINDIYVLVRKYIFSYFAPYFSWKLNVQNLSRDHLKKKARETFDVDKGNSISKHVSRIDYSYSCRISLARRNISLDKGIDRRHS